MPILRSIATLALLCATVALAHGDESHHTLWKVTGKHNVVYLFGSIHLLKAEDSDLPTIALKDYSSAARVVMELDPTGMAAEALQNVNLEMEMLPAGQTLGQVLGPVLNKQFQAHADGLGIEAGMIEHFQPWFAAMMLEQVELANMGLDPTMGVDMQIAQMANSDNKPIIGLETVSEQLGFFAHMSMEQQRQYLRSALKEADTLDTQLVAVVSAWKRGDTVALEKQLNEGSRDTPEFSRLIGPERNRKWLPRIVEYLNGNDNTMVVVGSMHLVGKDGLVELLRARGYPVEQQ
jgi:uncharacterized protein YbaP (TraB family)